MDMSGKLVSWPSRGLICTMDHQLFSKVPTLTEQRARHKASLSAAKFCIRLVVTFSHFFPGLAPQDFISKTWEEKNP